MSENLAIQISSLHFSWSEKSKILDGISLDIASNEYVSIIGRNGAGKSTLLKCIAKLITPSAGSIKIFGKPIEEYSFRELARKVAFLPQAGETATSMRVWDVVKTGRYPYSFFLRQTSTHEDEQAITNALALTGMLSFANRPFNTLSGGERQKVMLAAAIAQETPILLLDEPFTFLDPARQAEFEDILRSLHRHRGTTIVMVTHDLNRASISGNRIVGLLEGRVSIDAPPEEALSPNNIQALFRRKFTSVSDIEVLPQSETPRGVVSKVNFVALLPIIVPVALLFIFVFALIGAPTLSINNIIDSSLLDYKIFWQWRLPRSVMAFFVGSGLALAGVVFQAVFRNPLATPYTLGISSGASFGVIAAMQFGLTGSILGVTVSQTSAFIGALLSISIVYGVFRIKKRASSISTMLLAGVACSFLFSSLIMLLQYLCDPAKTIHTLYWMMGAIYVSDYSGIFKILPVFIFGMVSVTLLTKELDIMLLGDDVSYTRGVNINKVRVFLFFVVSLLTSVIVSLCGPIGFVGMMIPHICRLAIGASHKNLVPVSIAVGGIFLLACDTIARTVISPVEIPIGVITSFFGAPFLLFLLIKNKEI